MGSEAPSTSMASFAAKLHATSSEAAGFWDSRSPRERVTGSEMMIQRDETCREGGAREGGEGGEDWGRRR
eukprot:763946-Hanusia_phi.AAC.1